MAHIIHQFLIFGFIYNCNNLIPLLHIVGTNGFVNGRTAVEIIYNKLAELLLFFCDNADTALDVMIENKMIQNDSVKISSQNTENDSLFIIDKRS